MAKSFGLKILPLNKQKQLTISELKGLFLGSPPRRSPRRRSEEELILFLQLSGNAPLSDKASQQLLTKLAEVYFQTDGSTTSAMRNTADVLNKYLLDRNMRAASRGLRGVGMFTQIVRRENLLLVAQSGESHLYLIEPGEVVHLHDPELSGTGLGVSKAYKVRYHQHQLTEDQIVILTNHPPSSWNDNSLKNLPRMGLEAMVERLIHRVDASLEAVVIIPQPGGKAVQLLTSLTDVDPQEEPRTARKPDPVSLVESVKQVVSPPRTKPSQPSPQLQEDDGAEVQGEVEIAHTESARPTDPAFHTPVPSHEGKVQTDDEDSVPVPPEVDSEPADRAVPRIQTMQRTSRRAKNAAADLTAGLKKLKIWSVIRSGASALGRGLQEVLRTIRNVIARTLPDEQLMDLPSWVMGLIAVVVPIITVTLGSVFYIKRGRDRLYEEHFQTAQTLLTEAVLTEDQGLHYQLIDQAMDEITAAKNYRDTEEVTELYQSTREELDDLDRINRLDFQPLFNRGLGPGVTITEIVVTPWNDLYLLNGDTGKVIWAQSNPDGYEIKNGFSCGPIEGHVSVGPLVDIAALPDAKENQATLLGIDRGQKMIYCYNDLNETPVIFEDTSYTLPRGPAKAVTIASSSPHNLYILDPEKRAIWIEYESQNYHEGSEYFGAVDAPKMENAIDLATNGSEMYILHQDGYLTRCITESADADPQCTSPAEFTDSREGRISGPFIQDADFSKFMVKSSPGTALYILDADDQAVYRFSTQLAFQEQFRPQEGTFHQPATAFAVTISDRLFLAVDDQVYTAQMMP